MKTEGTRPIFVINFCVLHFFKFAFRMPQIAQILVSTFKIFWGVGGCPWTPLEISSFFSLAIPGSVFDLLTNCENHPGNADESLWGPGSFTCIMSFCLAVMDVNWYI